MAPEVRMRRPIRHTPKTKTIPQSKMRPKTPAKVIPIRKSRKTLKRPSPVLSNTNLSSANRLYDPKYPSPRMDTHKLFEKMEELQEMLIQIKNKRKKINVSMNSYAKKYLNNASYEVPLLEEVIKLKGIKGTSIM